MQALLKFNHFVLDRKSQFVPAGAGAQTVRWTFSKNSAAGDFQDAGWLDQLRILDFAEPELVLTELNYVAGTYVLDVSAISGAPDQKLGTSTLDITIQAQNQGEDLDPAVGAFTSADLEVRLSTDRIYGNVDDILLGSFAQVEALAQDVEQAGLAGAARTHDG